MTATKPTSSLYRRDIDGLRAVAILAVVGFHAFPAWLKGGYIGVDIFFVISGYLISGILLDNLENNRFSLTNFYALRVRRIFPALIAVLAAMLAFGAVVLWPDEYRRLGRHVAGGAGFVVNFLLNAETGYFQERSNVQPALHLWSLAIEEQFYIFWPLMLAAAWKWKHRAHFLIAAVIAGSFAFNICLAGQDATADFYSPFSRFWELIAGGALAWLQRHPLAALPARGWREGAAAVGLVLCGGAAVLFRENLPFPGWYAVIPVAGAVLMIAAGGNAWINRRVLGNPVMVGIGLISYPLYLWHWPLLSYAHILTGGAPSRWLRIGMVAVAVALAIATARYIEKPIRTRPVSWQRSAALIALLAALGGAGGTIALSGGWPSRFDATQARALDSEKLIERWQQEARVGTCHLQDVAADQQPANCVETQRPLLLLWGDSHAATLYPGLIVEQEKQDFGIAQLTQAGCPPLFDIPASLFRKNCEAINRRILDDIARLQPQTVMLSAAWHHRDYPMSAAETATRLTDSLSRVRQAAPNARIVVIGPVPHWTSPLPALYRREISFTRQTPPQRTLNALAPCAGELDDLLRGVSENAGAVYLSPRAQLCNADGCLTRLGDGLDSLAYVDEEHLTPDATRWLVARLAAIAAFVQPSDSDASR